VAPTPALADTSGGAVHTPPDQSGVLTATRCARLKFKWMQNTNAQVHGEESIKHKAILSSEAWSSS